MIPCTASAYPAKNDIPASDFAAASLQEAPEAQGPQEIKKPLSAQKPTLIGLTRAQMLEALAHVGVCEKKRPMRLRQLWGWLYQRGVYDFEQMTSLGKTLRTELADAFEISRPEIITKQVSKDGTRKYLLRIAGGQEIETVYIPEKDRGTVCVSSQVGCTLTCSFCHTGTQKLARNLTSAEIVGQILLCRDDLKEWPGQEGYSKEHRLVSNVVLMGMGEPLYNLDNVRDAMHVVMDPEGICLSRRRITLSTSGVVPRIARAGNEIGCMLAILSA